MLSFLRELPAVSFYPFSSCHISFLEQFLSRTLSHLSDCVAQKLIFLGAVSKQESTKYEKGPNLQDPGKTPAENVARLKGKICVV